MYTLPGGSPAGIYSYEVPENDRIYVKKGDIIAYNTGAEDERVQIPNVMCEEVSSLCLIKLCKQKFSTGVTVCNSRHNFYRTL